MNQDKKRLAHGFMKMRHPGQECIHDVIIEKVYLHTSFLVDFKTNLDIKLEAQKSLPK
jgi:hypothetical protein